MCGSSPSLITPTFSSIIGSCSFVGLSCCCCLESCRRRAHFTAMVAHFTAILISAMVVSYVLREHTET
ncbi:hypothetical protein J3E68DRAFT_397029 [Trichoderma sp. SZMC 28012]